MGRWGLLRFVAEAFEFGGTSVVDVQPPRVLVTPVGFAVERDKPSSHPQLDLVCCNSEAACGTGHRVAPIFGMAIWEERETARLRPTEFVVLAHVRYGC